MADYRLIHNPDILTLIPKTVAAISCLAAHPKTLGFADIRLVLKFERDPHCEWKFHKTFAPGSKSSSIPQNCRMLQTTKEKAITDSTCKPVRGRQCVKESMIKLKNNDHDVLVTSSAKDCSITQNRKEQSLCPRYQTECQIFMYVQVAHSLSTANTYLCTSNSWSYIQLLLT